MRTRLLFFLLAAALFTSCEYNYMDTLRGRVAHTWEYEEVVEIEYTTWWYNNTDITDEFKDKTITFFLDGSLTQINSNTGLEETGIWHIEEQQFTNTDGTATTEYVLLYTLEDTTSNSTQLIFGENFAVNNKRLRYTDDSDSGLVRYTLRHH